METASKSVRNASISRPFFILFTLPKVLDRLMIVLGVELAYSSSVEALGQLGVDLN